MLGKGECEAGDEAGDGNSDSEAAEAAEDMVSHIDEVGLAAAMGGLFPLRWWIERRRFIQD